MYTFGIRIHIFRVCGELDKDWSEILLCQCINRFLILYYKLLNIAFSNDPRVLMRL